MPHSSLFEQRCAVPPNDRAPRCHHTTTRSWWPSSPILPDLTFSIPDEVLGTHTPRERFASHPLARWPWQRLRARYLDAWRARGRQRAGSELGEAGNLHRECPNVAATCSSLRDGNSHG